MIAGQVTIGSGTYIGAGAVIRNQVTIGKNCIIGMGSLVTRDIPDNVDVYKRQATNSGRSHVHMTNSLCTIWGKTFRITRMTLSNSDFSSC